MNTQCPKCGQDYEVEKNLIGRRVECQCGHKFYVIDSNIQRRHFKSKLAGSKYYEPAILSFLSKKERNIIIEPNPENEYDENAIKVLDAETGLLLGHIQADIAEIISGIDGELVEFKGILVQGRNDFFVDFDFFYIPLPIPTKKDLISELKCLHDSSLFALEEYVSAMQSPRYSNIYQYDALAMAQKSLYALDPENKLLENAEAIAKWKRLDRIMKSEIEGSETMKSAFDDILQGAQVEYHVKNQPTSFLEFPMPEKIDLTCRFTGKNIIFTGFWPEEKAQLFPIVELLQIKQPASVCKKLDFLVCGNNAGPAKMRKAEQMNIPIIQAIDFIVEITKNKEM